MKNALANVKHSIDRCGVGQAGTGDNMESMGVHGVVIIDNHAIVPYCINPTGTAIEYTRYHAVPVCIGVGIESALARAFTYSSTSTGPATRVRT